MRFIREYSAGFALVGLALFFNVLHAYGLYLQGESSVVWFTEVMENMQSESWQVFLAAIIFKNFLFKGAPESKDSQE